MKIPKQIFEKLVSEAKKYGSKVKIYLKDVDDSYKIYFEKKVEKRTKTSLVKNQQ